MSADPFAPNRPHQRRSIIGSQQQQGQSTHYNQHQPSHEYAPPAYQPSAARSTGFAPPAQAPSSNGFGSDDFSSSWPNPPASGAPHSSQPAYPQSSSTSSSSSSWGAPPSAYAPPPPAAEAAPPTFVTSQGFAPPPPTSAGFAPPGASFAQMAATWNPAASVPQVSDPVLNAGLQAGAHMAQAQVQAAANAYLPGVATFYGSLRKYFQVDNKFVLKRLATLLFPFAKKDWSKKEGPSDHPASTDGLDLYVPLMSLVTYVLMFGLLKGSTTEFQPEILVDAFGSSFMAQLFQVLLMRGGLWLVGPWAASLAWLDMLAMAGYLYTGVAINLLVGVFFGVNGYRVCLAWTALASGYFMFRTAEALVPPPEPGQRGRRRRLYWLVMCAVLQMVMMWFLGYSRDMRSNSVFFKANPLDEFATPKLEPTMDAPLAGGGGGGARVRGGGSAPKSNKFASQDDGEEEEEPTEAPIPTKMNNRNGRGRDPDQQQQQTQGRGGQQQQQRNAGGGRRKKQSKVVSSDDETDV